MNYLEYTRFFKVTVANRNNGLLSYVINWKQFTGCQLKDLTKTLESHVKSVFLLGGGGGGVDGDLCIL